MRTLQVYKQQQAAVATEGSKETRFFEGVADYSLSAQGTVTGLAAADPLSAWPTSDAVGIVVG